MCTDSGHGWAPRFTKAHSFRAALVLERGHRSILCFANVLKKVQKSETHGICLPTTSCCVLYLLSPNVDVSVLRETTDRRGRGGSRACLLARPGWKCLSFVGLKFIRLSAWPLFIHKEIRNDEACQGEERPGHGGRRCWATQTGREGTTED